MSTASQTIDAGIPGTPGAPEPAADATLAAEPDSALGEEDPGAAIDVLPRLPEPSDARTNTSPPH
jgi:hypothetical protein